MWAGCAVSGSIFRTSARPTRKERCCAWCRLTRRANHAVRRLRGIFPAAAEGPDELDAGPQLHRLEIERLELRLQERGLGDDHREIVRRALYVERHGEIQCALRSVDC